jgi:uncharacterized protein (DUF2141 family)
MRTLQLLILLALPALGFAQSRLKVVVLLNKPHEGGVLHVSVYPSAKAYKADSACVLRTLDVDGATMQTCILDSLVPGIYVVRVFHDLNFNGKLDINWIGWPQEPYGFSNDAPVNAGPPAFNLAAIHVKPGDQTARIRLR